MSRRQLSEEEVLRWFQNMDFEVPHTRVPVDGYEPTHGAGPQLPDVSFVQYNYSMHIVEVDRTVVKTVQRALDLYKCVSPPSLPPHVALRWCGNVSACVLLFRFLTVPDENSVCTGGPWIRRDPTRRCRTRQTPER